MIQRFRYFERFLPDHTPDDLDAYIEKFESLAAVHDHMRMGHGVDLDSMGGLPEFDIRVARFKARERKRRRQKIEQQQLDEDLKHKREKKAKAKARRERKRRQRQEELERRWRSRQERTHPRLYDLIIDTGSGSLSAVAKSKSVHSVL